jgi:hypothetical protein
MVAGGTFTVTKGSLGNYAWPRPGFDGQGLYSAASTIDLEGGSLTFANSLTLYCQYNITVDTGTGSGDKLTFNNGGPLQWGNTFNTAAFSNRPAAVVPPGITIGANGKIVIATDNINAQSNASNTTGWTPTTFSGTLNMTDTPAIGPNNYYSFANPLYIHGSTAVVNI